MSSGVYNTFLYITQENLSEHLREQENENLQCSKHFVWVFRFESLEPEMNSQASRVAVVNQVARQLIHNGHPSEKEIKSQQDKLNTR